jgi:hypothetical protein
MKQIIGLFVIALAVYGCTTTEQANKVVAEKYIGTPTDNFFIKFGPPSSSYQLKDGGTLYTWQERAHSIQTAGTVTTNMIGNTAVSTVEPGANITIQCVMKIVADRGGAITQITVLNDSLGVWQMSRCNEYFSRR